MVEEVTVVIKSCDMVEEMQRDAVETAKHVRAVGRSQGWRVFRCLKTP